MNDWLRFTIYALAIYRLTNLFYDENGPGDVFDWVRYKAGIRVVKKEQAGHFTTTPSWEWTPVEQEWVREANGFWAKLLNCPLCLSVWFAALATVGLHLRNFHVDIVATWLALAAVSLILYGRSR